MIRTTYVAALACLLLTTTRSFAQPAEPNDRVVRAEAPVVAGNALLAKKRALADAFRQAAERALMDLINDGAPATLPLPVGVAQLKASLANSAQRFIRSYRLIEQGNEGGKVRVMVEADVDTVLLRRELDRVRSAVSALPSTPIAPRMAPSLVLVAGVLPPGLGPIMGGALGAAGVKAQLDSAPGESQLATSAAKQNAYALFIAASSSTEGVVRGAGQVSVKCSLSARLFDPGTQAPRGPSMDRKDEDRGFGPDEGKARIACWEHAAPSLARNVANTLRNPVAAPFVTLDLDIVEPGALQTLLQALKRLGAVTAAEVRHVTASMAEIRVFTRVGGPVLQSALVREVSGKLAVVPNLSTKDRLALRVRIVGPSALEGNP